MPIYRGPRSYGGSTGWEQPGEDIAQLIMALLFKKSLQAQAAYPDFEKAVAESQITGEGAPPATMIQKQPKLGKMYTQKTGKPAPGLEEGPAGPPKVKTMPSGAAVNVPQSTMKAPTPEYPTEGAAYQMRLEHEQLAGRALPQHVQQEERLALARDFALLQQQNPELAKRIATERGFFLEDLPPDTSDTAYNARVNTALKIKEDYMDVTDIELAPFVYLAGKLPNLDNRIRRPKEYAPEDLPNMTIEKFTELYKKPILKLHENDPDPTRGEREFLAALKTFRKDYRTVPEYVVPNIQKVMSPSTAAITARDMLQVLGKEDLNYYLNGLMNDDLPEEVSVEYSLKKARMVDERHYLNMARIHLAARNRGKARDQINKIYEMRGEPASKAIVDRVIDKLLNLTRTVTPTGESAYDLYEEPTDILREVEAETPRSDRPIVSIEKQNRAKLVPGTLPPPGSFPGKKRKLEDNMPAYMRWLQ